MITSKKTCFKCFTEKPLDEYYKHPQMADGHLNKCKECTKRDVSERYIKEFEKIAAYERKRFKDPNRKYKILGYHKKRRDKNPEKHRAYLSVRRAVKTGNLIKQPCMICGNLRVQAHHPDYSKPLEVEWLCFVCHRRKHGQLKHKES